LRRQDWTSPGAHGAVENGMPKPFGSAPAGCFAKDTKIVGGGPPNRPRGEDPWVPHLGLTGLRHHEWAAPPKRAARYTWATAPSFGSGQGKL